MGEFLCNIGEIVLRNDECFWILSEKYYVEYDICSPWFSFMKEKWCFVKQNRSWTFRLWRINNSNLPKQEYTVQLSLERTGCDVCHFAKCTADINSDYGCELILPQVCLCGRYYQGAVIQNGLLKIIFDIQKKQDMCIASKLHKEEIPGENEEISGGGDTGSNEDEGSDKKENILETKGVDRLVQDLKSLLLNGQQSDVTLKVGNREFKVHRNILIVRSPVFASMLQHDTKENTTGVVDIPDCSAEAFKVFLSYIYTGSVDNISSDSVFDLYYVADKYQVNDLKAECVEYIEENLSTENFCAVITLALQHSESSLQKKATHFFL